MAWTSPRTWTTSELVTAAIMNTHIRDNQLYLYSGKDFFILPMPAVRGATTNGVGAVSQTELTANRAEVIGRPFPKAADDHAIMSMGMPNRWNLGTVSFKAAWTTASSGTQGINFKLAGTAVADGQLHDANAFGTAQEVQDDAQGSGANQYAHLITPESSAITLSGGPTDDDEIQWDFYRDVDGTNDDLQADAIVKWLKIFYTTDQRWEA